jgi:hypothetical protein
MKKKGFLLVQVLMGLSLLGIAVACLLPIFVTFTNNYHLLETKYEIKYLGEEIVEKIKSYNSDIENDDYILDARVEEIINCLDQSKIVNISLPFDKKAGNYKYIVNIHKENINENLWVVDIEVKLKDDGNKINSIVYRTYIPNPKL